MLPSNVTSIISGSNVAVASSTGLSLQDYWDFGYYLIKQALGAGFGFIIAFWPLELVITIIVIVLLLARRAKNVGGRA